MTKQNTMYRETSVRFFKGGYVLLYFQCSGGALCSACWRWTSTDKNNNLILHLKNKWGICASTLKAFVKANQCKKLKYGTYSYRHGQLIVTSHNYGEPYCTITDKSYQKQMQLPLF